MDLGLNNKVAVVTGGTMGIGLATARVLAREGAQVVICGRSQEKLDAAITAAKEEGILLCGKTADVTDEASFTAFADWAWAEFGRVDILVNNAGRGSPGAALTLEKEVWQNVLDTNLTSVWNCSKVVSPYIDSPAAVSSSMCPRSVDASPLPIRGRTLCPRRESTP